MTMIKDAALGAVVASVLIGGAVLAQCTQIDAATKLVSYYQRYQELRQMTISLEKWYHETESAIQGFVPNLTNRLENTADRYQRDLIARAEGALSNYGVDTARAVAIADSPDDALVEYAGRNILGSNSACVAAALGLGRDVAPSERVVNDCQRLFERMVIPQGTGLAPNASISMNGMLATSRGQWPANNLIREDLNWLRQMEASGRSVDALLSETNSANTTGDAALEEVANHMRLGDLITGRGLSNTPQRTELPPSSDDVLLNQQMAHAARNSYAVEAMAQLAAARPKIETLREQLANYDIDSLDQMTEAQRYASRIAANGIKEELKSMLNESRLRHEQLEGVLLSIDAASSSQNDFSPN